MNTNKLSIVIPDEIHLTERNFKSLHIFFEEIKKEGRLDIEWLNHKEKLKSCFGNYSNHRSEIDHYLKILNRYSKQELFELEHKYRDYPIRLFPLIKAEILSYVMTLPNWYSVDSIPPEDPFIFEKLYNENLDTLLDNLAIAMLWIDYYESIIPIRRPFFTHCLMFGGSLIYTKTLSHVLQTYPTKVYLMEHFFTGEDYYCEENYKCLANNSIIRFPNVYKSLLSNISDNELNSLRIKANTKILSKQNKNVPSSTFEAEFNTSVYRSTHTKPTIVILGQVQNDFSILETNTPNINLMGVYTQLITYLLEHTHCNIIFKAHPWERKKNNIKSPLIKNHIEKLIARYNAHARVLVVEHCNIEDALSIADFLICMNSQGALESAFYQGLKPIVLGNPFYGQKGFTHDTYTTNDLKKLAQDIASNKISGFLSLDEFEQFEIFLAKILEGHLLSNDISQSLNKLQNLFNIQLKRSTSTIPESEPIVINKGSYYSYRARLIPASIENFLPHQGTITRHINKNTLEINLRLPDTTDQKATIGILLESIKPNQTFTIHTEKDPQTIKFTRKLKSDNNYHLLVLKDLELNSDIRIESNAHFNTGPAFKLMKPEYISRNDLHILHRSDQITLYLYKKHPIKKLWDKLKSTIKIKEKLKA